MKKVSFDFDGTLSNTDIQAYASRLIRRGFEVWICTCRMEDNKAPSPNWNYDLFEVAGELGIKRENIIFCNLSDKASFLANKDFIFHIDDDLTELSNLKDTDVIPVSVFGNKNWEQDCEKAIMLKINETKIQILFRFLDKNEILFDEWYIDDDSKAFDAIEEAMEYYAVKYHEDKCSQCKSQ
jgi:hypothetical protein